LKVLLTVLTLGVLHVREWLASRHPKYLAPIDQAVINNIQ